MNSVKFGDKDSYKDWGLILKPKSRPLASPKTNYVTIEGKDGDLDLTTSLTGDVKYQNVNYTLEFTLQDKRENWETKIQEISTYLHGKKMNVIFSEDADWYCVGRMTLNELTSNKALGIIKIDCNFEPYKLKTEETIITEPIEAGKVITLPNSRKWVMPTIESCSNQLVDFSTGTCSSGTTKTFENDILTITGDGEVGYQNLSFDITDVVKKNAGKELFFAFESAEAESELNGTVVQLNIKNIDGTYNYYHIVTKSFSQTIYNIPEDVSKLEVVGLHIYSNNHQTAKANSVTFIKPMLQIGREEKEYQQYNHLVNFDFEGVSYSTNGTLKTPSIILKEGDSKITLTGGQGNIEISYREGKL